MCVHSVVLDVVLVAPAEVRAHACAVSSQLVRRLAEHQHPSHFQLGLPYPDEAGGICEPHVSLFMLQADGADIDAILRSVAEVGARIPAMTAIGEEFRHNPHGAPELYYRRTPHWVRLQRAVIDEVEPWRRGRLRDVDPSGDDLARAVRRLRETAPDDHRLRQLLAYGYDEVADAGADRFNPHITLTWPADGYPVSLDEVGPPEAFSAVLTELAVYGMSGQGTCTRDYGRVPLAGQATTDAQVAEAQVTDAAVAD